MTAHKRSPAVGSSAGQRTSTLILRDERLLIQSLILRPAIFDTLGDLVLAIDFSDPGFSGLFAALKSQYETTGDIQIDAALKAFKESAGMTEGSSDDGCLAEMVAMLTSFCPHWNWPYYARKVTDAMTRRRLTEVAEANAADAANHLLSTEDVLRNCERRASSLRNRCQIETKPKTKPKTKRAPKQNGLTELAKELLND